jgi:hypothetical protein
MAKGKSVIVTFRVDEHLASALERLPDKSSFIRAALEKSLHEPCPACAGKGVVDCNAAAWLTELLAANAAGNCACCAGAMPGSDETTATADTTADQVCGHCGPDGHIH